MRCSDRRAVEEGVEGAELAREFIDGGPDGGDCGDVEPFRGRVDAGAGIRVVRVAEAHAAPGQRAADRGADVAGAAEDDGGHGVFLPGPTRARGAGWKACATPGALTRSPPATRPPSPPRPRTARTFRARPPDADLSARPTRRARRPAPGCRRAGGDR